MRCQNSGARCHKKVKGEKSGVNGEKKQMHLTFHLSRFTWFLLLSTEAVVVSMAAESKNKAASIFPEIVRTLVSVIEEKDEFIRGHSVRVAQGCVRIAKRLKRPKLEQDRLFLAGLLHDIGMVYVPPELIAKPGKLTDEEMGVVKKHPVVAEKILSHLSLVKAILPAIRHHHEAYDGSGYPDALRGSAIPAGARIIAIVDSYDAMLSARPHRPGRPPEAALEEMLTHAGTQFDPELLKIFAALIGPAAPVAKPQEHTAEQGHAAAFNDIIQKVKSGKIELPVLPAVINEIQKIIKSPIATTEDLSQAIEKDAVISLKLIATSNSSLYRGAKKVLTVREAVPRLGLKQTQSVVNAIANRGLYQVKNEEFGSLMEKLWTHALASAYAARSIAKQVKLEDIEKYFLYGLIHDIGKVLMLKALLDSALTKEVSAHDLTVEAVMPVMQKAHTEFGGMLLERWGFSKDFMNAALLHEGPGFSDTTAKEVLVVHLANMLTRAIGCSLFDESALDLAGLESARLLGLDGAALETIKAEIQKVMQESPQSF